MEKIESKVTKYNQVKIDLIKIFHCIDCCSEDEKEIYQDIALNYSKQLKSIKESIERIYGIELSGCCAVSNK
ncbi:hypothetical protein C1N73_34430 (plasmid) [Priestia aryabhattai]